MLVFFCAGTQVRSVLQFSLRVGYGKKQKLAVDASCLALQGGFAVSGLAWWLPGGPLCLFASAHARVFHHSTCASSSTYILLMPCLAYLSSTLIVASQPPVITACLVRPGLVVPWWPLLLVCFRFCARTHFTPQHLAMSPFYLHLAYALPCLSF